MDHREVSVRKSIHTFLLSKDRQYQRIVYAHVSEQTGITHVQWIDREGRTRTDRTTVKVCG
jgi:hypothetical protein